jgi:hypothetical protein
MPEKKTLIYAGVGVVVIAAIVGIVVAVKKQQPTPPSPATSMLGKAARAVRNAYKDVGKPARAIDYDSTQAMWADEDAVYRAASKLDGGYSA